MPNATVTRRYARALYEEARQQGRLSEVDGDMELIRATLDGSRELVGFFQSPVISRERKEAVVRSLFGERLSALTLKFMRLLIAKKRDELFPEIVRAYRALRDEEEGIVEAKAQVAYPFREEERKELQAAIERLTGQSVRLELSHSDALLGGVIVRVGDTVYDGSVRHRLSNLRERMGRGATTAVNGQA